MAKAPDTQNIVKPTADGLAASARAASKGGLPPVHLWDPPFCGDLDIRIARDGTWFYLGTPIGRKPMVRLFSTILKREGDAYFLVTPVEKVGITVDDAPFVAVDFDCTGDGAEREITFLTNVGDRITADDQHPIRVMRDPESGEPAPYVMVRDGLEALIDRKSFYRLVDICDTADHEGRQWLGLWSRGAFFPVIPTDDLP